MDNVWETFKLMAEGGIFGAAGQDIQVFLALIMTRANSRSIRFSRLCANVLVGFGIGSLGVFFLIKSAASQISYENIFTLMALGYAGGDFVDKIVKISSYNEHPIGPPPNPQTSTWDD